MEGKYKTERTGANISWHFIGEKEQVSIAIIHQIFYKRDLLDVIGILRDIAEDLTDE